MPPCIPPIPPLLEQFEGLIVSLPARLRLPYRDAWGRMGKYGEGKTSTATPSGIAPRLSRLYGYLGYLGRGVPGGMRVASSGLMSPSRFRSAASLFALSSLSLIGSLPPVDGVLG